MLFSFNLSQNVIAKVAIETGIVPEKLKKEEVDLSKLSELERTWIFQRFNVTGECNSSTGQDFITINEFLSEKRKEEQKKMAEAETAKAKKEAEEQQNRKLLNDIEATRSKWASITNNGYYQLTLNGNYDEDTKEWLKECDQLFREQLKEAKAAKMQEEAAEKEKAKKENDAMLKRTKEWAQKHGSQHLQDLINLGYEFIEVAKYEMAQKITGCKSLLNEDEFSESDEVVTPSETLIIGVKKLLPLTNNRPIGIFVGSRGSKVYYRAELSLPNGLKEVYYVNADELIKD